MPIKALLKPWVRKSPLGFREDFFVKSGKSGQVTFLALLLCLMGLSYFFFCVLKCQNTHREIQDRLQTYSCFHGLDVETELYIKRMAQFNMGLRTTSVLMLIPGAAPELKTVHEGLKALQQALHFSYMKKLLLPESCSLIQSASYVRNLPYKTQGLLLLRKADGTLILNQREWTVWVASKKGNFALKGQYKLKDAFTRRSSLETKEEKPSLKGFFG